MPNAIDAAFRLARYRVFAPAGEWRLQPDRYSPELAVALARHACREACLLTAFNPRAQPADAPVNLAAQAALAERLRALALPCLAGENADPQGGWREPTLLAFGLSRELGLGLACGFGQVAFLHAGANAVPRLVYTGLA
jgi:hypothetical protein